MKKKNKIKKPFYCEWWFWLIIVLLFSITWLTLFISDSDLRTSIIGICGIWGSTIATIFIGIIASKQSRDYDFKLRKENLITEIRREERQFLEDFGLAFNEEKYFEVLFANLSKEDSFEDVQKCGFLMININEKIRRFRKGTELYNYCSISIKKFIEGLTEFEKFLKKDLFVYKKIEVIDETSAKKFQAYYVKQSEKLMEELTRLNYARNAVVFEMQIIINSIITCKTIKKLETIESVLLKRYKENFGDKIDKILKASMSKDK